MTSVIRRLADFSLDTKRADLPAKVQQEAVRAFLNYVGCALGGSNTPVAAATLKGLSLMSTATTSSVLGHRLRLDPVNAAVANCLSSAAHTYDDTHLKTITHPTGPIAAAILALADTRRIAGEDALTALTLGMEIECRLSVSITAPGTGAHGGWYITGVSGGIGAAAAACRLMRLGREETVSALGLAATQACGIRATHGSMAIAYVPGLAARNGLTAAYMAAGGLMCSDIAIDGRNGLLEVLAPRAQAEVIDRDLGRRYEVLENAYKPYPCGIVIHPAIDACLQIVNANSIDSGAIKSVALDVHNDTLRLTWRKHPETELDAQVSVYHWIAVALVCGAAGLDQAELKAVMDPRVRSLQERIAVNVNNALESDQARAVVTLHDGRVFNADIKHATGSIERPMTDTELDAKFTTLSARVLHDEGTAKLLNLCRTIGGKDDVAEVSRLGTTCLKKLTV